MTVMSRMTTAAFEAFIARPDVDERRYELIDGEIVERALPTREHAYIAARLSYFLWTYFEGHPDLGGDVGVEARHRPTGDESNDRLPDVSVVLGHKPIGRRDVTDYMPDICIEVKSPDDRLTAMRQVAQFYLDSGARAAAIVNPDQQTIEIYTGNGVTALTLSDSLTFPDLLPGFSVPLAKLFPPPQDSA